MTILGRNFLELTLVIGCDFVIGNSIRQVKLKVKEQVYCLDQIKTCYVNCHKWLKAYILRKLTFWLASCCSRRR